MYLDNFLKFKEFLQLVILKVVLKDFLIFIMDLHLDHRYPHVQVLKECNLHNM